MQARDLESAAPGTLAPTARARNGVLSTAITDSSVEQAVEEYRRGRFAVMLEESAPEGIAYLTIPARATTDSTLAFMLRHTSRITCVALPGDRLDALDLPPMVCDHAGDNRRPFAVAADARHGITTGVSVADRVTTIHVLADPRSQASGLVRPGHVHPLRGCTGGVLQREDPTDAALDLCRMGDIEEAAVLSELVDKTGSLTTGRHLSRFAERLHIPLLAMPHLVDYRARREPLIRRIAAAHLPTRWGSFRLYAYRSAFDRGEHAALVTGDVKTREPVPVRIGNQCIGGDVFGSSRCDCLDEMDRALEHIAANGRGVYIYLLAASDAIGPARVSHETGPLINERLREIPAEILTNLGVLNAHYLEQYRATADRRVGNEEVATNIAITATSGSRRPAPSHGRSTVVAG